MWEINETGDLTPIDFIENPVKGLSEIDIDGNWMPSTVTETDDVFELDVNDNVMSILAA